MKFGSQWPMLSILSLNKLSGDKIHSRCDIIKGISCRIDNEIPALDFISKIVQQPTISSQEIQKKREAELKKKADAEAKEQK